VNTSPVNASADLSKERVLHAVATHLRINLQEARCRFGLFGWHSYTTVLALKILNINGVRNGQNPVLLGNAVQWSQEKRAVALSIVRQSGSQESIKKPLLLCYTID
jgi:hypothetical protein